MCGYLAWSIIVVIVRIYIVCEKNCLTKSWLSLLIESVLRHLGLFFGLCYQWLFTDYISIICHFILWHFYQWHFYRLALLPPAFLPFCIFTTGIITVWHFYYWHFYHLAYLPMTFLPLAYLPMAFLSSVIFTNGIFNIWHFHRWHFYLWQSYLWHFYLWHFYLHPSVHVVDVSCVKPPPSLTTKIL